IAPTRATEHTVRRAFRPRRDRGRTGSATVATAPSGGPATVLIGSLAVRGPDRNGAWCASSRRTVPDRHGAPPRRGELAGYRPVNPGRIKAEMGDLRSVHHQNRSAGPPSRPPSVRARGVSAGQQVQDRAAGAL